MMELHCAQRRSKSSNQGLLPQNADERGTSSHVALRVILVCELRRLAATLGHSNLKSFHLLARPDQFR